MHVFRKKETGSEITTENVYKEKERWLYVTESDMKSDEVSVEDAGDQVE